MRVTEGSKEEKEIALICLNYRGKVFSDENEKELAINSMLQDLKKGSDGFMHFYENSTFQTLYSMIEEWRPFIE